MNKLRVAGVLIYIGNGPNFMARAIGERARVKMSPSAGPGWENDFGYFAYPGLYFRAERSAKYN
jgi:hypothetical protein